MYFVDWVIDNGLGWRVFKVFGGESLSVAVYFGRQPFFCKKRLDGVFVYCLV